MDNVCKINRLHDQHLACAKKKLEREDIRMDERKQRKEFLYEERMEKRDKYHNEVNRLKEMIEKYKLNGIMPKELKELMDKQEYERKNNTTEGIKVTNLKLLKIKTPQINLVNINDMQLNTPRMNKQVNIYNNINSDPSY